MSLTFRQLETARNKPMLPMEPPGSPIELWYRRVRETPLSELSASDLARACRQGIFVEDVIPEALGRLRTELVAGDWFGELLQSLMQLPLVMWTDPENRGKFRQLLDAARTSGDLDPEDQTAALRLISAVDGLSNPRNAL
jgi:hypothetical protein